jgi:hypothetical protein
VGVVRFIAKDPYAPAATEAEIEALLVEMSGISDWTMEAKGEVRVEYDSYFISSDMIEEALEGLGFKLKHISEDPETETGNVLPKTRAQAP